VCRVPPPTNCPDVLVKRAPEAGMTATRAQDPAPAPHAPTPAPYARAAAAGLSIRDVSLTFHGARTVHVLDQVSLQVGTGEVIALIGPNGCGKSTLLRVLSGLIASDAGAITVGDTPVTGPDPRVGLVFQEPRLLAWRSAEDNVRFPMELAGWSEDRQTARADDLLGLVGLREFARAKPSTLSGGTRQRVAIARALALEPSVLLMDEPFSALDALTRERFNAELLRLWERTGTTILIVTHSIPEAIFLADRVIVMSPRPGTVVADIRVEMPRPRRLTAMDSALVSSLAADVRSHLVDTTDDRIAMAEDRTSSVAEAPSPGARPSRRHVDTEPGTPAWFDPFRPEDEP
jgi:NitT/TauT family transport system ATP-binding protein